MNTQAAMKECVEHEKRKDRLHEDAIVIRAKKVE